MGQVVNRQRRHVAPFIALTIGIALAGCRSTKVPEQRLAVSNIVPRGGELIVSDRAEPKTFNRHAARDTTTDFISSLMQAKLVRINHATDVLEPWLADSWSVSDDGRVAPTIVKN